jgi:hypothetical protein
LEWRTGFAKGSFARTKLTLGSGSVVAICGGNRGGVGAGHGHLREGLFAKNEAILG